MTCSWLAHDLHKTHMTRAVSDYDSQLKKMVPRAAATTMGRKLHAWWNLAIITLIDIILPLIHEMVDNNNKKQQQNNDDNKKDDT